MPRARIDAAATQLPRSARWLRCRDSISPQHVDTTPAKWHAHHQPTDWPWHDGHLHQPRIGLLTFLVFRAGSLSICRRARPCVNLTYPDHSDTAGTNGYRRRVATLYPPASALRGQPFNFEAGRKVLSF